LGVNAASAELTVDTAVDYLRNRPLLLDVFLSQEPGAGFLGIAAALPEDIRDVFGGDAVAQLGRLVSAIRGSESLLAVVASADFVRELTELTEELFASTSVVAFLRTPVSGEFCARFEHKGTIVSLERGNSVVSTVADDGNVLVATGPTQIPAFSPSLDPLFNPDGLPVLFIPVGTDAVLLVLHTEQVSFTWSSEDRAVASFVSLLLRPLMRDHMRYATLAREREIQHELRELEAALFGITQFGALLPFVRDALVRLVDAEHARVFCQGKGTSSRTRSRTTGSWN